MVILAAYSAILFGNVIIYLHLWPATAEKSKTLWLWRVIAVVVHFFVLEYSMVNHKTQYLDSVMTAYLGLYYSYIIMRLYCSYFTVCSIVLAGSRRMPIGQCGDCVFRVILQLYYIAVILQLVPLSWQAADECQ